MVCVALLRPGRAAEWVISRATLRVTRKAPCSVMNMHQVQAAAAAAVHLSGKARLFLCIFP